MKKRKVPKDLPKTLNDSHPKTDNTQLDINKSEKSLIVQVIHFLTLPNITIQAKIDYLKNSLDFFSIETHTQILQTFYEHLVILLDTNPKANINKKDLYQKCFELGINKLKLDSIFKKLTEADKAYYENLDYGELSAPFINDCLVDIETEGKILWKKNKQGYYQNISPFKLKREIRETYPFFSPQKITSIKESIVLGSKGINHSDKFQESKIYFKNGYLDLKTEEFKSIEEDDIIIDPVNEYRPELGESERFITALKQWFPKENLTPDNGEYTDEQYKNDIEFILELIAYFTLIPHINYQVWVNLYGVGSNGKSIFMKVVEKLRGSNNVAGVDLSDWNRFTTSSFLGKNLVIGRDSQPFLDKSSYLKKLVGDEPITVEIKGKTPVELKHNLKVIISTNELIRSKDKTHSWFRRIISLPFTQKFTVNPDFEKELTCDEEILKIQNTLVERAIALEKRRELRPLPHFCQKQKDEIQEANDPVYSWWSNLEEYEKPDDWMVSDAFEHFKSWYESNYSNKLRISLHKFGGTNGKLMENASKEDYNYKRNKAGKRIVKKGAALEGAAYKTGTNEMMSDKDECHYAALLNKKSVVEKNENKSNKNLEQNIKHTKNKEKTGIASQSINNNKLEGAAYKTGTNETGTNEKSEIIEGVIKKQWNKNNEQTEIIRDILYCYVDDPSLKDIIENYGKEEVEKWQWIIEKLKEALDNATNSLCNR